MIIDNHVHVGWFSDGFHSPREVWISEMAAGINGMAVASTSTCAEIYKNVCRELREIIRLGGARVHPLLWLTPRMLKKRYPLPYMLHSKIEWQGVKLHFEAHPEWSRNKKLLDKAINVARKLSVPVLFHTGNDDSCHAGLFKSIIQTNGDLTFVLAHGRPIDETIDVLHCCPNVFADTAFMPISDILKLVDSGLSERILFGSDAPINKVFYKDVSTEQYLTDIISAIRLNLGEEVAEAIFERSIYSR